MSTKTPYRVGITGSYGGLNLGDEAILQSMIEQLRRELTVEITVFSRDAEDTRRRHKVERAVEVRKLSRAEVLPEIERLDLLLFGGGGILYDADARAYLREVELAKEKGVPVMVYAVGAGPLSDTAVQAAVREALEGVAAITVRERSARQVLEEAGIHRDLVVTADPALLLTPEPLPRNVMKAEGLEFDMVISSPLERALHTAQIICKEIGFPTNDIVTRLDIVERDFGMLECNKKLVAATRYMIDESAIDRYKGVESLADLQKRADGFWEYLQKLSQDRVLIVGHGAFGRALRRSINQQSLKHRGASFHNAEYERFI